MYSHGETTVKSFKNMYANTTKYLIKETHNTYETVQNNRYKRIYGNLTCNLGNRNVLKNHDILYVTGNEAESSK